VNPRLQEPLLQLTQEQPNLNLDPARDRSKSPHLRPETLPEPDYPESNLQILEFPRLASQHPLATVPMCRCNYL
jgi:hypothetical protein